MKNERVPEPNILASLNCEKRAQPPKSNLTYKQSLMKMQQKNFLIYLHYTLSSYDIN